MSALEDDHKRSIDDMVFKIGEKKQEINLYTKPRVIERFDTM